MSVGTKLYNPAMLVQFDTTVLYNAAAPVAWQDLDLSGVVGVRSAVVVLRVNETGGVASSYRFRRNGETVAIGGAGTSFLSNLNNNIGYAVLRTDALGIIEWYSTAASACTVSMEAFTHA